LKGFKYIIISIFIIIGFNQCREPFSPDISKYENLLVVDGLITDQAGPHTVRLARSFSFDESFPEPEEGAVIFVMDEEERVHPFLEDRPGTYLSEADFRGSAGKKYRLIIQTLGGESYESEWVELKSVPEIDSVTYAWEERPTADMDQNQYGMHIRVNTHDETGATRYYRWEWIETWEFITPMKSSFYLNEERCWKTTRSSQISIGTTEQLREDIVTDQSLYFVSTESNKLRIKYSALVRQFSLSQEAYSYWKNLEDINQNTGSLFDPTPSAVTGNMYNPGQPDVPVLGIFQASSVREKRIFIEREELPRFIDVPSGYSSCEFFETADSAEIVYYFDHGFPFADQYMDGETLYYIFSNSEACFRCTLAGTNEEPDFWPDEE
jgi:hypothetical protein